jgi:hypothetical protein
LDGFSADRWLRLQLDAVRLLQEWGEELMHLGWGDTDVWGIRPTHSGISVHCYGLAACLNCGRIVELTADTAVIVTPTGSRLTYRRRPLPEAVPLWKAVRMQEKMT